MIVYLGEVDARGLFREHAYPSLFAYAVGELRMSEAEAYLRIHAARVARAYPAVIPLLASGEVNLSTIKLIGPVLTAANHSQLLRAGTRQAQARCGADRFGACASIRCSGPNAEAAQSTNSVVSAATSCCCHTRGCKHSQSGHVRGADRHCSTGIELH
jgi:hypothetical protein